MDKAIHYALENDFDTLLSVVNHPQLGWLEKDWKLVPDYERRLNRQFLPKHFLETGAFVISKRYVLDGGTRFGEKVSVFEVGNDEAIDIDDFNDFVSAENILNKKNIAIVVNGNNSIGMGHIYRMLELADMFYAKPTFYYDKHKTEKNAFGKTTYELYPYNNEEELIGFIRDGHYDIVINDIQNTEREYIIRLRGLADHPKIVNFEDLGSGAAESDLVINALYDKGIMGESLFSGEDYYIVPKSFALFRPICIKETVRRVFVCFGGADPRNYTESIIEYIQNKDIGDIEFCIVLGRAKSNHRELLKYNSDRIHVLYDVKSIPALMSQCDVAITSRGRTCFELAYLGIPTLSVAQNRTELTHAFVSEENGFISLDDCSKKEDIFASVDTLINLSYSKRVEMHEKMLAVDLSKGRARVKDLILDL